MFDCEVSELTAAGAAAAVSAAHQCMVEQECLLLQLAAHWADLHHPDSVPADAGSGGGRERARRLGGEGTPEVLEFAAAELGARQGTTTGAGRALLVGRCWLMRWICVIGCRRSGLGCWLVGCGCGGRGRWRRPPGS